jgi:hypothetical protein
MELAGILWQLWATVRPSPLLTHRADAVQMTAEQEEAWSSDANCYVMDEDVDAFGARSSCEMLLSELQVPSPDASVASPTTLCTLAICHLPPDVTVLIYSAKYTRDGSRVF